MGHAAAGERPPQTLNGVHAQLRRRASLECACVRGPRCLRRADAQAQHRDYMRFFGPYCAAEVDMEEFEAQLLAQNMEELDEQRAQWASQQAFSQRLAPQRLQPPKPPPKCAPMAPAPHPLVGRAMDAVGGVTRVQQAPASALCIPFVGLMASPLVRSVIVGAASMPCC